MRGLRGAHCQYNTNIHEIYTDRLISGEYSVCTQTFHSTAYNMQHIWAYVAAGASYDCILTYDCARKTPSKPIIMFSELTNNH